MVSSVSSYQNDDVYPFIVNGRDVDPMNIRVSWKQYFPPRDRWVIFRRHRRQPLVTPLDELIETAISEKIQTNKDKSDEQSISLTELNSETQMKISKAEPGPESKSTKSKVKVTKKRHRKHTANKSAQGKKVKEKQLSAEEVKVINRVDSIEFADITTDIKPVKQKKTRRTKISASRRCRKSMKHRKSLRRCKTPRHIKYKLHSIKSIKRSKRLIKVPKFTFNNLPRLPIPDTWRWKSKKRHLKTIPHLPLAATWKWYDNPNQFRKGHGLLSIERQSSDCESVSSRDTIKVDGNYMHPQTPIL